MDLKKIVIIIAFVMIVCLGFSVVFFKGEKQEYVIREWNNYAQTVNVDIADEKIITATKSVEPDSKPGVVTGGQYTLFTIRGLKQGTTTVTVTVVNPDSSVELSKVYYLEVNRNLDVKLQKVENIDISNDEDKQYVIKEWNNYAQTVKIDIADEKIISATKSVEPDGKPGVVTGGQYTLFTIKGLKSGTTTATVTVVNPDNSIELSKVYYLEVNDNLEVSLVDFKNIIGNE